MTKTCNPSVVVFPFLSKASRQTRPFVLACSRHSASCCGCRQPPRRRCHRSGRRLRCLIPKLRLPLCRKSACGWANALRPCSQRCRPQEPWKTGRSPSRCRSTSGTGTSWSGSGSSGSGFRGMVEAGRWCSGWRREHPSR